ncbi:MAG: hypothetical protein Q9167_003954 [Letrouitia subvulpina]
MALRVGYATTNVVLLPNFVTQFLTFGGKHDAEASTLNAESEPDHRKVPEADQDQDQAKNEYFKVEWLAEPPQISIMKDTFLTQKLRLYNSPYTLPEIKKDIRHLALEMLDADEILVFRCFFHTVEAHFYYWFKKMTPGTNFSSWGWDTKDSVLNRRFWELAGLFDKVVEVDEGYYVLDSYHERFYDGNFGLGLKLSKMRHGKTDESLGDWESFIPYEKLRSDDPGFKAAAFAPKKQAAEAHGFEIVNRDGTLALTV